MNKNEHSFRNILPALALCFMSFGARADAPAGAPPHAELWLNPGFYAYHFQRNRNLNNNAAGFGAEYRYSATSAIAAGAFHNSNWSSSRYLAYYWRPVALGPMRFGAVVGVIDGYPGTRKGGWFPVAIPTASVDYGRVGVNVFLIPTIRNSVNGSITFQLNVKVY